MKSLSKDWITEGTIDFEYKKYVLLAYLQHCQQAFGKNALYPPLGELVDHYKNLKEFSRQMKDLRQQFPRTIQGIDTDEGKLIYRDDHEQDEYISTISEIVEFAKPTIKWTIDEGRSIYEFAERHIELMPLGILPVYRDEGYLLLNPEGDSDVRIYQYRLSVVSGNEEKFRALELSFVYNETRSLANTVETIKLNLIRKFPGYPNPATYLCRTNVWLPVAETVLPVSKRMLMRELAA